MAFKMKSPLHNGDKKSKTPQVDKFMKMNERPSKELHKSIGGYSPLHPIEKANLAIHKGLDIVTLGYAGPRNRKLWSDTADEKERAEARTQLPAPGNMGTPLYLDPNAYGLNQSATTTGEENEDESISKETGDIVVDKEDERAEKQQEMMDDKGAEDNPYLRARIDIAPNKAKKARLKGRLDRRLERQEERAKRLNLRNYGNVEGIKQQDKPVVDGFVEDKEITRQIENDPDIAAEDNNVIIEDISMDSPNQMKPNRAGRPVNSNMLMTNPVIKTGKHSAKDAVAKLRMRKIAQSE